MDIILEVGLEHKILELHCTGECGDTDYTLYAEDKDGLKYALVYLYDEDWDKYIEEHPEDTDTGEAWEWLIKNSNPNYIGCRDEDGMWTTIEEWIYLVEVKNIDEKW